MHSDRFNKVFQSLSRIVTRAGYWCAAGLFCGCIVAAAQQVSQRADKEQQNAAVRIEKLLLIGSPSGPVRSVAFTYDFSGHEQVVIKGLGTVPARGAFAYLTLEDKLDFFEPGTGRTLLSIPLENPLITMGRYTVTLPAATEFPSTFRTGRWDREGSFQVHLTEVLNRQFPLGYMVLQVDHANAILTTYRPLDGVREPLYGRIAVIVELPTDASRGTTFRVRFTTQERRSHTDWQELGTEQVQKAVEQYMSSLIHELEGGAP